MAQAYLTLYCLSLRVPRILATIDRMFTYSPHKWGCLLSAIGASVFYLPGPPRAAHRTHRAGMHQQPDSRQIITMRSVGGVT